MSASAHQVPLYGLVVCGGESLRMGTDKSLLQYHGKPQRYHVADMLLPFCDKVFLSCNEQQAADIAAPYSFLVDAPPFTGQGPLSALLTAYHTFPNTAFLVLGCDYPFLTAGNIEKLCTARSSAHDAVCYSLSEAYPEPLLALYEQRMGLTLFQHWHRARYSLSKALKESRTLLLPAEPAWHFQSIDTPEDFYKARKLLSDSR